MTDADRIVDAARLWVGTPFDHQARLLGSGCDCIGLVKEVGVATGFLHPTAEDVQRYGRYSRAPNPRKMREGLQAFLEPAAFPMDRPAPDGVIAWMQWREDLPMHVGIAATFEGRRTIIHAVQDIGKVVEHGFSYLWLGRVVAWFIYPGMRL